MEIGRRTRTSAGGAEPNHDGAIAIRTTGIGERMKNLETRVGELVGEGDVDAANQLIRAAISCGADADYRFEDGRIHVSHPAYTGTHEVHRRPVGGVRIVSRGEYRFVGESGNASVELEAVNSKAVQFGRERVSESALADAQGPSPATDDRGERVPSR
jgi:hypothetical protein